MLHVKQTVTEEISLTYASVRLHVFSVSVSVQMIKQTKINRTVSRVCVSTEDDFLVDKKFDMALDFWRVFSMCVFSRV